MCGWEVGWGGGKAPDCCVRVLSGVGCVGVGWDGVGWGVLGLGSLLWVANSRLLLTQTDQNGYRRRGEDKVAGGLSLHCAHMHARCVYECLRVDVDNNPPSSF